MLIIPHATTLVEKWERAFILADHLVSIKRIIYITDRSLIILKYSFLSMEHKCKFQGFQRLERLDVLFFILLVNQAQSI